MLIPSLTQKIIFFGFFAFAGRSKLATPGRLTIVEPNTVPAPANNDLRDNFCATPYSILAIVKNLVKNPPLDSLEIP